MTIVLIIILLIVLSGLIMIGLVFQDDNTDKYNSIPSNALAQEVAMSAIEYNEAYITQDGLNSLIAYVIQQANNSGVFNSSVTLNAVYIELNSDTSSRLYFQISYKEKDIGVSADVNIYLDELDGNIKMELGNASVGKLRVPNSVLSTVISKLNLGSSTSYFSINELTVSIPSHYSLSIENIGTLVDVDILSFDISDGEIYIQTNPITIDIVDNLMGILGDKADSLKERFGDLF